MKAIVVHHTGGEPRLAIGEAPEPYCGPGDLLVRVRATALNRADLLQKRGRYPPPSGATDILGLEMAGIVERIGTDVTGWKPGDRVCALLPGGGYAEQAVIPASMAMPIPESMTLEEAAAIPEAFLTAHLNLFRLGCVHKGNRVLVHAGASGVGTAAIQLARAAGAEVFATAGSPEKLALCRELGAADGWNYKDGSFRPWLLERTAGSGVDVILDLVGASHFEDNIQSLAMDGRMIVIGLVGGALVPQVNLGLILAKRLTVMGSALRSRSVADKAKLTQDFLEFAYPKLERGIIRPIIDRVMDWSEAEEAHRRMERNVNRGKIVLSVGGSL